MSLWFDGLAEAIQNVINAGVLPPSNVDLPPPQPVPSPWLVPPPVTNYARPLIIIPLPRGAVLTMNEWLRAAKFPPDDRTVMEETLINMHKLVTTFRVDANGTAQRVIDETKPNTRSMRFKEFFAGLMNLSALLPDGTITYDVTVLFQQLLRQYANLQTEVAPYEVLGPSGHPISGYTYWRVAAVLADMVLKGLTMPSNYINVPPPSNTPARMR